MSKTTEISQKGIDLIISFENFEPKPYLCPSKVITQGFGTTINPDTGKRIKLSDPAIDRQTAMRWLKKDCETVYGPVVDRLCRDDLTQNEFDAALSFTYNTGGYYLDKDGNRRAYQLYELINKKTTEEVLKKYWSKTAITGLGKVLNGLIKRRNAEANLYFLR